MTGADFKAARIGMAMTQARCAKLFGVSELTVLRWERGNPSPPAARLMGLIMQQENAKDEGASA